jgi:hypothetical protein
MNITNNKNSYAKKYCQSIQIQKDIYIPGPKIFNTIKYLRTHKVKTRKAKTHVIWSEKFSRIKLWSVKNFGPCYNFKKLQSSIIYEIFFIFLFLKDFG